MLSYKLLEFKSKQLIMNCNTVHSIVQNACSYCNENLSFTDCVAAMYYVRQSAVFPLYYSYHLISMGKEGMEVAEVKIRNTGERIQGEENVRAFLESQEVLYEHWNPSKLPAELQNKFILSDEEKQEILTTFDEEIRDLASRRGYLTWDIIALSDATPNLDELLKKFENVHTHTEDEVRAITAGKGIFIIKGTDDVGYFDVELEAGDVISVPEHKPHFFTLMDNRQIVAVRLFIETEGWIAHPYSDPQFQTKN